jgi:hypothetical protein
MRSYFTGATLSEKEVVRSGVSDSKDVWHSRGSFSIQRLDLEDVLGNAAPIVSEEALLADPVMRRPTAVVVLPSPQELEHVLTVRPQDAAVVGLREVALSHPPQVSEAVGDSEALDCHPCGRRWQAGGVEANELLAQAQVGLWRPNEAQERLEVQKRLHRTTGEPGVSQLDDDRAIGAKQLGKKRRQADEPPLVGWPRVIAIALFAVEGIRRGGENELHLPVQPLAKWPAQ